MERSLIIGASGGIGAALADHLAAAGGEVLRLSRSGDGLDVTDGASVSRAFGGVTGEFDRVIVASGILAPDGGAPEKSLDAVEAETMARVMAVNAVGPALILKELPRLLPRDRVCRVAVLTARVGSIGDNKMGGWYAYRASKAAANQVVHTAAIEIGRKRKQAVVVALHPGTVATPFTENYPGHKKVPASEAAANLIGVLDGLTPAQSGGFFDWAGQEVPW
ncbi:MAG: SDR family NAD(P)-dependent oxidoreductase [Pseudomonadota bacterium]